MKVGEKAPKAQVSGYGVSKLNGENYLFAFRKLFGIEGAALRYSNVFGPRQDPNGEAGVVAVFCSRILAGEPLTVFGDGLQTRDYVYAGDVARANLVLTEATLPEPPEAVISIPVMMPSRYILADTGMILSKHCF